MENALKEKTQELRARTREVMRMAYPANLYYFIQEQLTLPANGQEIDKDFLLGTECAVLLLPTQDRELVYLYFRNGIPASRIAQDRGVSTGYIYQSIRKICRQLRHPRCLRYILYGFNGAQQTANKAAFDEGHEQGYAKGYRDGSSDSSNQIEKPGYTINIASLPLDSIGLMQRSLNCLSKAGFTTVDDIVGLTEREVLNIRCMGMQSVIDIAHRLQALGIRNTFWNEVK